MQRVYKENEWGKVSKIIITRITYGCPSQAGSATIHTLLGFLINKIRDWTCSINKKKIYTTLVTVASPFPPGELGHAMHSSSPLEQVI